MAALNPYGPGIGGGMGSPVTSDLLNRACQINDVDQVARALMQGAKPDATTLDRAISTNNQAIVQKIQMAGAAASTHSLTLACRTKNLEIVKSVIMAGGNGDWETMLAALRSGDMDLVHAINPLCGKSYGEGAFDAVLEGFVTVEPRYVLHYIGQFAQTRAQPGPHTLTTACKIPDWDGRGIDETIKFQILEILIKAGAKPDDGTLHDFILSRPEKSDRNFRLPVQQLEALVNAGARIDPARSNEPIMGYLSPNNKPYNSSFQKPMLLLLMKAGFKPPLTNRLIKRTIELVQSHSREIASIKTSKPPIDHTTLAKLEGWREPMQTFLKDLDATYSECYGVSLLRPTAAAGAGGAAQVTKKKDEDCSIS